MKKYKLKNQRNKLNKRKTKKKSRFSKRKTNKKYNHRRKKTHNKRGGAGDGVGPATLSGDDWVEVGMPDEVRAEVWPGCGIKTHIELITHGVYRILKENKKRQGTVLLFIVEEREVISDDTYLSGIYHKLYFVDDEEGTHDELQQRYANKPFQYDLTSAKVRGSTPLGCSIAGWGIEISSIVRGEQPLYKGILKDGPGIPSHLDVLSLKSPEDLIEVGGKPGKYKGAKDKNFSIDPIRLALDPETYTSEGGGADESANLNVVLSFMCINGYGKGKRKEFFLNADGGVDYDDKEHVITINNPVGLTAKTRFKSGNGTVMALLNNSFEDNDGNDHDILYTEDTYHRDFIIRHLESLVNKDDTDHALQANEIVANLDYIFFQSEMGVKEYALIGQGTGNLVHFQSELDRDYKVGIGGVDSVPRKTMCKIKIDGAVQMKCYFDTHPEYPLEVDDGSEKNKNLLIFKLDVVEKMIINIMRNYPDLLTPNKYQIERSDDSWSDVEGIELKHNGTVMFFFQGSKKPKTMVEVEEALKVADTESHTFLKLK